MLQLWLVLDDPALLNDVLEAWTDAGVRGVTILESTGVQRMRARASAHDAPFMLGFSRLLRTDQVGHNTLFAVVRDMETVERAVAATGGCISSFCGGLDKTHETRLNKAADAAGIGKR